MGLLLALEQVHLPVASCLFLVGTFLSSVQGLVSKVFAWLVYWNQPGCDNLVPGTCQSLQRHLGTHARIISLLVISLDTCFFAAGVWAATSFFVV